MLKQHFKVVFSSLAIASNLSWQIPVFAQDQNPLGNGLGQSDWQTQTPGLDSSGQSPSQNTSQELGQSSWQNANPSVPPPSVNQSYGQSDWQNPINNSGQGQSSPPSTYNQNPNPYNSQAQSMPQAGQQQSLGQSGWQTPGNNNMGQSAWQQPQSAFQANTNQPNNQQGSDYYYGQANQNNQPNPVQPAPQPNYSNQNNNQGTWQTLPPQQGQVQKSSGGLKQVISGVTQTALTGARIMAPVAGMYMYGKAMARSPYAMGGYGMPYGGMPYGGMPYGGYPPMPYGYGGMGGLSSFMHY